MEEVLAEEARKTIILIVNTSKMIITIRKTILKIGIDNKITMEVVIMGIWGSNSIGIITITIIKTIQ